MSPRHPLPALAGAFRAPGARPAAQRRRRSGTGVVGRGAARSCGDLTQQPVDLSTLFSSPFNRLTGWRRRPYSDRTTRTDTNDGVPRTMKIGIGTYSLFWEFEARNPAPLDIPAMVDRAARLGCEVFQICDDPRVEQLDTAGLHDLRERAELLGVELELGTRTIGREHLGRYLDIAEALGARTLRSMIQSQEVVSGPDDAVSELRA